MNRNHWLLILAFIAFGIALFVGLLIVTAPPAIAPSKLQPINLDDATLRVAKSLYCPVCPGVPLDVCETQACQQWRELIRQKLAAGQTQTQIQQYFVQEYGDRVLGAPPPQGLNLAIYAAPVLGILAGIAILSITARHWVAKRASPTPPNTPGEYVDRIERELRETE